MTPLPLERVQVVPSFSNAGLDFMGPLYLKTNPKTNQDIENKSVRVYFRMRGHQGNPF